jgi:uncharacterized membrane protein
MNVYSYTILMPPIFYHLKTRYFVKKHPMHSQICLQMLQLFQIGIIVWVIPNITCFSFDSEIQHGFYNQFFLMLKFQNLVWNHTWDEHVIL